MLQGFWSVYDRFRVLCIKVLKADLLISVSKIYKNEYVTSK